MIHLFIASLIWAAVFGITKYTLPTIDPQLIAFIRCAFAAILFLPFFFIGKKETIQKKTKIHAILIGALYGFMYTPYIMAYKYLNAYQIGLLTLTASLYVCFFNDLFQKKLHFQSYIYAALSMLGSFIMLYRENSLNIVIKGALLVEMASLCFSFAQVSYKKLKQKNPKVSDKNLFSYIHLTSAIVAASICYLLSDYSEIKNITNKEWSALIYLGIFATGIAFYLWNKGCTQASIAVIVVANNLKVPIIAGLSYFVFQEKDHPIQLLCGALIIGIALFGAELHSLKEKRLQSTQPAQ